MIRSGYSRATLSALTAVLLPLLAIACSDGTPSVSSSNEEVSVSGTVTYKGKKPTKGTITFDPSNVQRKMAAAVTAPIGPDGTYTIKTLVGGNMVSFDLPEYKGAADREVGYARLPQDVQSGQSKIDFELPRKP